ncbi:MULTISPECIES: DUF2784 domain-containing protein [Halomonadaceae]|jgi:hypothetical protein|uniref:DUF2784 domain-containing protein n=1 Tax=Vreelandella piezotolerans TaxID=2609667 RepID=A0ABQ6X6L0_9GAMM|nr:MULTISPECIES: DUF2784 domain-containing protein [Halomonas]KFC51419.1 hypothetical protein DK37_16540 [Halomonas sp. SUBG004]KAE8437659.1 DUF2784 domain-containing protein [Halomonas piezotolerans]MCG7588949.1 DUF2784 domain-containing protein [Halomonas sp. McD50-5]MCG7615110.1 DUF2784 domain-containing protein [Halomonas sp. McD50-4]QJA24400.1 DUF2784 domain-containing protein [Halomonas piezotolerans]
MLPSQWLLLADLVLILHVLFVAFVVVGVVAIYVGRGCRWAWVHHRPFRLLHLSAIGYVVAQAWLGVVCPLTTLEMALRAEAGVATYAGSFIQHWLHRLLYFSAPEWVFAVVYTLFGGLVLASWWVVPPRRRGKPRG